MMADNADLPHRPVMFMAGNDSAAKETVSALLSDIGFEPLDAGDLTKARLLEPYGMVWINQALVQGKGRDWRLQRSARRRHLILPRPCGCGSPTTAGASIAVHVEKVLAPERTPRLSLQIYREPLSEGLSTRRGWRIPAIS